MVALLSNKARINRQIMAAELRVVDENGQNLGVLPFAEAFRIAQEKGLDLIEISPNTQPPVAKIMEHGKYLYLENKKASQSRVRSHRTETKNIQIKIGTGEHDLELKAKKVSQFLSDGHRVKIDLFLPGRAKYLEPAFLRERVERILKLITTEHKVAEEPKKSPKGMSLVIERK